MDMNSFPDLDGLGMRRRYGGGGGGLIEGFETGPLGGTLTWTKSYQDGSSATSTVTSSALHVTQGSASWKITGNTTGPNYPGIETGPLDISSYTTISVDVYVETVPSGGHVIVSAESAGGTPAYFGTQTTNSTTGAYTLTWTVADIVSAGLDPSNLYIEIFGEVGNNTITYYVDNLRGS